MLSVLRFSDFENVSTTAAFNPMPAAPFAGVTINTVGAVVSVTAAVVNELKKKLLPFPDRSNTPLITSTCTVTFPGSGETGVNVTVVPFTA